ncbi:MAG: PAS domain S-box protein [Candidatus Erginobacter occultus]|nr:PAS domain S-box protein [Candidatus Erginobacter occultus]
MSEPGITPEEILNFAIDQIPVPVIIASAPDVTITHFNRAALDLLARTDTEITGIPLEAHREYWPTFYPDGTPYQIEDLPLTRAIKKGEVSKDVEIIVRNPDGDRWILARAAPLRDKDGNIVAGIVAFPEITNRKRAEKAARAYDRLCRMAKDLICLADIETATFTQVNPAFTAALGYSEEELLGRPFLDYVHPDDRAKTVAVIEEKLKQGAEVISFINRYRCQNGSYRWLDWNSHPVEKEGVTYAIAHDITERKKAEEELRTAYQFLDRVIDLSPFSMWISDIRGTVIRANRALCQTINLSSEAIIGSYNVLKDRNLEQAGVMDRVREVFERHRPARFSIPWKAEYSGAEGFEKARDMFIDVAIFPILDQEGKLTNVACQWVDITDQKTAEKALEESLLRQQAAVRAGRVGLWDWDLSTDKVSYSAEWKRQIGYEEDEISDDFYEWESRVHPDDLQSTLEAIRGNIDSDRTTYYEVEFRFRHQDGSYRWILAPATILRDEKGQACRVMGTHIDITERKRAEEELRRSEELLRQTGEMALVGGWEIDLATDTVTWSQTTRTIHEVREDYQPTLAEAINFFDPAARPKLTEAIRKAREEGSPYDLELPLITARGRKLWTRAIGKADFRDGSCVRVHGTFQDITTFKEVADALEESERRYRQLVENINDAIFSIDREGIITYISPVIEEITGYRPEETAGKHFADFIFEEDLAAARRQFESIIGGRDETREYRLLHKQGGAHWVRISARSLRVEGEIVGLQGTVADIEERKRIEAELIKARNLESLGLLAGGIAHDFNNILTAILGNISYLRMGIDKDSAAEEVLTEAEAACRQANHLTHQLLTFSSGGQPIAKTASLEKILREAARFSLHGSNVKCRFRMDDDLRPVLVDSGQIAQVINNLVINADQAMPEGGEIEIRCLNREVAENEFTGLDPGWYVRIEIADQGIGIGPDQLSRIFDPYFTTKEKGRGLGLATAFSIIKNHRGRLTVDSSPGEGTVFTILLPAAAGTVEEEKEEERIIRGGGRILVMDDEPAVLKTAARVLESLGYQVGTAREGKEAVEIYHKALSAGSPFKAVILDLTVQGGMGGEKTLVELKKLDPRVKAIVSSGYSTDGVMAEYKAAGFAGMIAKPYDMRTFSRVVADVLNG